MPETRIFRFFSTSMITLCRFFFNRLNFDSIPFDSFLWRHIRINFYRTSVCEKCWICRQKRAIGDKFNVFHNLHSDMFKRRFGPFFVCLGGRSFYIFISDNIYEFFRKLHSFCWFENFQEFLSSIRKPRYIFFTRSTRTSFNNDGSQQYTCILHRCFGYGRNILHRMVKTTR